VSLLKNDQDSKICFGILSSKAFICFFLQSFVLVIVFCLFFAPELSGRDKDETYSYVVHRIEFYETLIGASLLL